ncbi:hypothetical protein P153DRAFT_100249 [Dothidotthia symphoricarpi CBS 119687]|uniref:Uncharacterized protein n=1 Tax=Dothidotthia symphoricarpi CBS 119687 TaxID=1392245 RepID=A0A6A6AQQ2_9PLEO|nr:uncharacterized protein P153DRAFT_100249 [Dothidotthia symphoricarpi CBS 119687]KAF2133866.1 hypothetical protein P153DRAFT_100249 [Dothidotthia symphoricarpi CBS 119687]
MRGGTRGTQLHEAPIQIQAGCRLMDAYSSCSSYSSASSSRRFLEKIGRPRKRAIAVQCPPVMVPGAPQLSSPPTLRAQAAPTRRVIAPLQSPTSPPTPRAIA